MACELIENVFIYVGNLQAIFLLKIVDLRPGPKLHKQLVNVIARYDKGVDIIVNNEPNHLLDSKA
jgi:hypothetical protein